MQDAWISIAQSENHIYFLHPSHDKRCVVLLADAVHMVCLHVVEVEAEIFLGEDRGY